jgi:hypothetical protein
MYISSICVSDIGVHSLGQKFHQASRPYVPMYIPLPIPLPESIELHQTMDTDDIMVSKRKINSVFGPFRRIADNPNYPCHDPNIASGGWVGGKGKRENKGKKERKQENSRAPENSPGCQAMRLLVHQIRIHHHPDGAHKIVTRILHVTDESHTLTFSPLGECSWRQLWYGDTPCYRLCNYAPWPPCHPRNS